MCDALVVRLSGIDWAPKDRAAKFMIAAAYYSIRRPPEVAWESLQQLMRWSGQEPGKISKVVREYAERHGLVVPEIEPAAKALERRNSAD